MREENEKSEKVYSPIKNFIFQSQDASRFLSTRAGFMVIACLASAWFGYDSYHKSLDSAAKTLWFPLQTESDLASGSGANYLDQIAEQNEAKRLRFIEEIPNDESIAVRFASDYALLLRASIQSDLKLRGLLIERLRKNEHPVKDSMLIGRTLALCGLRDDLELSEVMHAVSVTEDSNNLNALGQCLNDILGEFNSGQAVAVIPSVLGAVQKAYNADQLWALGKGLAAVAGKSNDAQVAVALVAKYVETVQKATDGYQFWVLGEGLAVVAGQLNDAQAAAVVAKYVETTQKTTDDYQFQSLGEGLAAVAGHLNGTQAADVVIQYVETVQKTTDNDQLQALGEDLAAMAGVLREKNADIASTRLITALQTTPNGANKAALSLAANKLIPNLTMNKEQARIWLQISNIPFIDRDAVAAAIRKHYPDAPSESQGIWTFLKWANSRFGVNRPHGDELLEANLNILLLPLLVLLGGALLLQLISGRKLVSLQLKKLTDKKDRLGLGLRLRGYTAEQAKTHWSVLGADERVIEQRFLWMDQVFAPLYGFTFLYALLQASDYLDDPLPRTGLIAISCLMVIADWSENTLQLQQLKRLDSNSGGAELQAGRIRMASLATQIKLVCVLGAIALLIGFSVRLSIF